MTPSRHPRLCASTACATLLALSTLSTLGTVSAAGATNGPAPAAPALAAPGCAVPAGLAAELQPGRLVLMGEVHGTEEAPAAFGAAVCHALEQGRAVSVGLEFSRGQAGALAAYLASDGGESAVGALLRSAFWTRAVQDGRSSAAMLALVERLRQLKRDHPMLAVFSLEDDAGIAPLDAGTTGDQHMAARVRAEHARRPQALVLTLSGNLHNRLAARRAGPDRASLPQPMGALLADLAPRAVQLDSAGGSAWVCSPDCGVQTWPAPPGGLERPAPGFRTLPDTEPYTGQWSLGPGTASPPAVRAVDRAVVR